MGKVKFSKGSDEFMMFRDYWTMVQEHWIVEDSEGYWEKVVSDLEKFYERHTTPFAKGLVLAYTDELERKYGDTYKKRAMLKVERKGE